MSSNFPRGRDESSASAKGLSTSNQDGRDGTRGRSQWFFLLVIAVIVAGGAFGIWWFQFKKNEAAVDPPIPTGIQEVEVMRALEKQRDRVLENPKSADAWGEYAMLLIAHLFDQEAEFCFTRASQLNPDDPRWPYTRGHIALKKDPPNAADYLRQAIATTGPGEEYRTTAKLLLAETLLEQGNLDEATQLFNEELGPLRPGQPWAVAGLAMIATLRGDEKTAVRLWTSLLEDEHVKKQANVHLAEFARRRGDEEAAKRFEFTAVNLQEPFAWPDPMYDVIPRMAVGRRGRERMIFFLEQRHQYYEAIQAWLAELEIERSPKAPHWCGHQLRPTGQLRARHRLYAGSSPTRSQQPRCDVQPGSRTFHSGRKRGRQKPRLP